MDSVTATRVFRHVQHASSQVSLHSEWHHDEQVCFVKIDLDQPLTPAGLMGIGCAATLCGAGSVAVRDCELVIC